MKEPKDSLSSLIYLFQVDGDAINITTETRMRKTLIKDKSENIRMELFKSSVTREVRHSGDEIIRRSGLCLCGIVAVSFWVESLGSLTYRITSSAKRHTLTSSSMRVSLSSFVLLFQLRLQALYWLVLLLETGSLIVLVLVGLGISLVWLARQPHRVTWMSFPSLEVANTFY